MRLFYGLPFPHRVRRDLLLAQRPLLQNSIRGNFTSVTNFHLTLAFLGEVEEARLPLLFSILDAAKQPPFDLLFTHLDHFDGGIWYLSPAPRPLPPSFHFGKSSLRRPFPGRILSAGASLYAPPDSGAKNPSPKRIHPLPLSVSPHPRPHGGSPALLVPPGGWGPHLYPPCPITKRSLDEHSRPGSFLPCDDRRQSGKHQKMDRIKHIEEPFIPLPPLPVVKQ